MAVMDHTRVSLTLLMVVVITTAYPTGPTFRCDRTSPQLDHCVRDGLTNVISYFKAGSQQLGLPPLDPMEVPYLQVRHDDTNLSLEIIMKNVNIFGISDIRLAKVTTNLDDINKVEVTGKTPALHITGEYVSEGLIVTFPLHSAGSFSINMTEVTSSWVVYLQEMERNQTAFMQIEEFDVDMMPINISFRAAPQLDGDNNLGDAVNTILNENSHEIYSIIKTKLASVFSGVLTELANQLLSQIPEREYLLPKRSSDASDMTNLLSH